MPLPNPIPTWSTNATFVSPGDPWDGDPTKVDPGAGKRAEGWEPSEAPPAEFLNFWKNGIAALVDYLAGVQAFSWSTLPALVTTPAAIIVDPSQGISSPVVAPRYLFTSLSAGAAIRYSDDRGLSLIVPATEPTVTHRLSRIFSNQGGTELATGDDNVVPNFVLWESSDGGANWTERTAATGLGASTVGIWLWFDATVGFWLVSADGIAHRKSANGIAWSALATPPSATTRCVGGDEAGIILVGGTAGIDRSTDGNNFSNVLSLPGAGAVDGIGYSAAIPLFYAVGTDDAGNEAIWTSSDGTAWAQQTDASIQARTNLNHIQTDRGELVLVWDDGERRLYYSTDRGQTLRRGPQLDGQISTGTGGKFAFNNDRFFAVTTQARSIWNTLPMP